MLAFRAHNEFIFTFGKLHLAILCPIVPAAGAVHIVSANEIGTKGFVLPAPGALENNFVAVLSLAEAVCYLFGVHALFLF